MGKPVNKEDLTLYKIIIDATYINQDRIFFYRHADSPEEAIKRISEQDILDHGRDDAELQDHKVTKMFKVEPQIRNIMTCTCKRKEKTIKVNDPWGPYWRWDEQKMEEVDFELPSSD